MIASGNDHTPEPMETDATARPSGYSGWFLLVASVFVAALIAANITAVKLVGVAGLILPAAIIIFPVSYIVGDVLTRSMAMARRGVSSGSASSPT